MLGGADFAVVRLVAFAAGLAENDRRQISGVGRLIRRLREAGAPATPETLFFGLSLAGPTVVTHGDGWATVLAPGHGGFPPRAVTRPSHSSRTHGRRHGADGARGKRDGVHGRDAPGRVPQDEGGERSHETGRHPDADHGARGDRGRRDRRDVRSVDETSASPRRDLVLRRLGQWPCEGHRGSTRRAIPEDRHYES